MKKWLVIALLLVPALLQAQTVTKGPVTTSMRFEWECPANLNPFTPTECLTYEYRLRIDNIPATALTGVTCAAPVAPSTAIPCRANLNQSNVDALNRPGAHAVTLSAFRADQTESGLSLPFILTMELSAPTQFRIVQ